MFTELYGQCDAWNGAGKMYYDALCASGTDAKLLSAVYHCVDASPNESLENFDVYSAASLSPCRLKRITRA
jgi:hypothetical protein